MRPVPRRRGRGRRGPAPPPPDRASVAGAAAPLQLGRRPAEPLAYTRVHPDLVVELVVDPAVDGPRWRHPASFVRLRPDLHATDLAPTAPAVAPIRHIDEVADQHTGGV